MTIRPLLAATVGLAAVGLSSCAMLPKVARWVDLRPAQTVQAAAAPASRVDALYDQAVAALRLRDYGLALDVLQVAQEADPHDARVLNALGVAYDKLGRFDLSGRYYAAAANADPGSQIVAGNQRYSQALRTKNLDLHQFAAIAAPPSEVSSPATATSMSPAGPRPRTLIAQPSATPVRLASGALLIGPTLRIEDASGKARRGEAVRANLAREGWTVGGRLAEAPAQARTTVSYSTRHAAIARALVRTLPFPVIQTLCETCTHLELRVGQDARSPRLRADKGALS